MPDKDITFKASTNGLVIILNDKDNFEDLCEKIEEKFLSAGKFFKGAELVVKYRGRDLNADEEKVLLQVVEKSSGAKINTLEKDNTVKADSKPAARKKVQIKKHMYFQGIEEGQTKFYRGTVRSGQLLEFPGNVVVLGDVNPGAEIRAAGNVVVTGTLRGVVHAGCDGNRKAVISAYNLQPTQLRIADVIARPPDGKKSNKNPVPEIAYVNDGVVYIEKQCHK